MKTRLARMGGAFALLMLGATAGFAAGSVELASPIDSNQASATASGGYDLTSAQPGSLSLSADGRYAAFLSAAANLVPGQRDVNNSPGLDGSDVFLADLVTGAVTLVSHAMGLPNITGNNGSSEALISADGRFIVFRSAATDLVPGQQGHFPFLNDEDLLLYDRVTGATTLVAATRGEQAYLLRMAISADGRYVTYDSDAYDLAPGLHGSAASNVFLYDRVDGSTRLVSHAPGDATNTGSSEGGSSNARISADGRFIVFLTYSDALLPGQIPADGESIVLYDRATGALTLVGPGEVGADISSDGKVVVFSRDNTLRLYARETGVTTVVSTNARGTNNGNFPRPYALNADGRFLAFCPYDTPSGLAIYDRISRTTTAVSRPAGAPPLQQAVEAPWISGDGRFVAFANTDPAWVAGQNDVNAGGFLSWDVFLFDRSAGKVTLVSHAGSSRLTTGNQPSFAPAISADGRRVVYLSRATDLVDGLADRNSRPDLFAYDAAAGSNRAITLRAPGLPSVAAAFDSQATSLSADGRFVAFQTFPPHPYDSPQADVLLYDATAKTLVLVNHARGSAVVPAKGVSTAPTLSADGRYVAFYSDSRSLVPGANPTGVACLFLFDRTTGVVTFVARYGSFLSPDSQRSLPTPRFSADGRWLAFLSKAPDVVPGQQEPESFSSSQDLFLFDRTTGQTVLVSHAAAAPTVTGNFESSEPAISADGRYIAFLSSASDLIPGETRDFSGGPAAYLYDRVTGTTALLSHRRSSPLAAVAVDSNLAMSSDGRYTAFGTAAADLDPNGPAQGDRTIYIHDRAADTYERVAAADIRQQVALSADGRILAFPSRSRVLPAGPGLYLYDRVTKALTFASRAEVDYRFLALSADGRAIAFASETPGLLPGLIRTPGWDGTDIYLYDRIAGTTILVDQWQGSAVTAAGFAEGPLLSADGRRVAFSSLVGLVAGDYNRQLDAYLFSLDGGTPGGPVAVPPCILFDSRRAADGPALRSNAARVVKPTGTCGVPATAKRVTAKVTVFQGTGKGNVRFYPGDLAAPSSGILRFSRGQSRSATFDLPVAPNGAGTLTLLPFVGGNGTVGVSVEIDGYTP